MASGGSEDIEGDDYYQGKFNLVDLNHEGVMQLMLQDKDMEKLVDEKVWREHKLDGYMLDALSNTLIEYYFNIDEKHHQ